MAESLMQLYDSMTLTAQKELYDFAKFLVSKDGKKNRNLFFQTGVQESAKTRIFICRRILTSLWTVSRSI